MILTHKRFFTVKILTSRRSTNYGDIDVKHFAPGKASKSKENAWDGKVLNFFAFAFILSLPAVKDVMKIICCHNTDVKESFDVKKLTM